MILEIQNKIPRYTKEKIDKTLESMNKLIELDKQKAFKMHQMITALNRIKFAMIKDFDMMILTKLRIEKDIILKEIDNDQNLTQFEKQNKIRFCSHRAKIRLMNNFNKDLSYNEFPRWEDFKWQLKKQWKKDREQLIKKGDIE